MINISKLYCSLAGQSDHLRYGTKRQFGPVVVYNCTSRCNLKCLHCYSSSKIGYSGDNEMDTTRAKKLLAELTEENCPVVLFSGGEPLLRTDLFERLAEAKKLGLKTVISTNGTLISLIAAKRLGETAVSYVGVSIDGDEDIHDKFRAASGSFKQALRGIANCKKTGLRVGMRFTITAANAGQIPAAFDIAADNGIRRICFYHLLRTGRGRDIAGQVLSPDRTRRALDTIIEKTSDFVGKNLVDEVLTVGNHADGPYLLVRMLEEKNPLFDKAKELLLINGGNRSGEKIACISWDGCVYPDQFWRNYSLGNIKNESFAQIWNNKDNPVLNKLRNKDKFADKRCLGCGWFDLCRGNYRFLGSDASAGNWLNEPACYLTDKEIES